MVETILVATDGSDGAAAAAAVARAISARLDASLHGVAVVDEPELPDHAREAIDDHRLEEARSHLAAFASAGDGDVETAVLHTGAAVHETIIAYADEIGADCIVMGTAGRTGVRRLAFGSVAERTVRAAPIPVVVVPPTVAAGPIEEILVPTDGSDGAQSALDHAVEIAERFAAGLHLLHVVDLSAFGLSAGMEDLYAGLERVGEAALEEARSTADDGDVRKVEASLMSGRVDRAIREYVDDRDIDLLVMGTHGRSGLERFWLGSTTERVIRRSSVPVVTIKSPAIIDGLSIPDVTYAER